LVRLCFVFPGQGSQYVGMGKEIHENVSEAREIFSRASDDLGYDVGRLCFEGPAEELNRTVRTQPCILTASTAILSAVTTRGLRPSVVAGHSLGEYSALVAAGVISFTDAVKLSEKRAQFMQEAVPEGRGLMAAILGLDREKLTAICGSLKSGYASPANYNSPGQIVIAGEKDAVEEAMKLAKEAGAKRAVPLAVSVPSHCELMAEASRRLGELMDGIEFRNPEIPLVNNADAKPLSNAQEIKESLVRQLNSPLLWEESVKTISDSGVDIFVEVGPGKILSGLIKRIVPAAKVFNIEDMKSLEETASQLSAPA
jgi:[acyl-carrier-protein] S-malonyltransferase